MENPPAQTQTPKSNNQSGLTIFLSVLILALIGTTAFLYLWNQNLNKQIALIQSTPTTTPTSTPTKPPIILDTAAWKTYVNKNILVSFLMPPGTTIQEIGGVTPPFTEEYLSRVQDLRVVNNNNNELLIISTGQTSSGPLQSTAGKYYKDLLREAEKIEVIVPIKKTDFLGHEAYTYTVRSKYIKSQSTEGISDLDSDHNYRYLWFDNGSTRFSIIITDYPESETILSTLKLADNQTSVQTKKHFVATENFFDKQPYPSELTQLSDSELVGFSCSNKFENRLDSTFVYREFTGGGNTGTPESYTDTKLVNKNILAFLLAKDAETKKTTPNGSVLSATICQTDTGKTLVSYDIIPGGGGAGSSVYYGYLDGDQIAVAEISMEDGPYFTCGNILAITKSNSLYVECGAGDGGFGSKSLYRVGLYKSYSSDLLLKCTSVTTDSDYSNTKVTCGNNQ